MLPVSSTGRHNSQIYPLRMWRFVELSLLNNEMPCFDYEAATTHIFF